MRILTFESISKLADVIASDSRATKGMSLEELCRKFSLSILEIDFELQPLALEELNQTNLATVSYSTIAKLVRGAVGELDYSLAKDARVWLSLVFGPLGALAEPEGGNEQERVQWISDHWFARTHRDFLRNHSISQYWWTYEILSRQDAVTIDEGLALFDAQKDLRTQIVDRTAINGNSKVVGRVLKLLMDDLAAGNKYDRKVVRELFSLLNFDLGRRELEILDAANLDAILSAMLRQAKISAV
jgi:Family of unknown function (DUF6339)